VEPEARRVKLARRIVKVLEETGPREPALLQRILRAARSDYERAVGHLVLKGLILFRGKTSGRKVHLNGRRAAT
jgi:hypothetical protein